MSKIEVIKVNKRPLEKLIAVIKTGLGGNVNENEISKQSEKKDEQNSEFFNDSRIEERVRHKESRRQNNLDYINYVAAEQLDQEPHVSEEQVDEDWINRFYNIAEDISNDEMKIFWGRILAGEIKQPKSFSLRTLDLLKNLSKDEAQAFSKFAQLRLVSGDKNLIYNQDNGIFLKDEFGIEFTDRLLLAELGLIATENNLEFSFSANETAASTFLIYGPKAILFHREDNTPKQAIKVLLFTKIGAELCNLVEQVPNQNYLERVCSSFAHPKVTVEYGDLIQLADGNQVVSNKVKYENNTTKPKRH